MPIWGNTGALGQNGRGKVNRSRPTYYNRDKDIHLHRLTTVDVIQYLDREFEYSAFLVKNAIAKSVLDRMTHNLQSPVICVANNFMCNILCDKIMGNTEAYVFD